MKAILQRTPFADHTKGSLFLFRDEDNILSIKTLELPWYDNSRNISCIPEGTYEVERHFSPTKGSCFLIKDVPGRSDILIHAGNYVKGDKIDSKGCLLTGTGFKDINKDGYTDIRNSRLALNLLLIAAPQGFKLIIT